MKSKTIFNYWPVFVWLFLLSCEQKAEQPDNQREALLSLIDENEQFMKNEFPSLDSIYDALPAMTESDIERRAQFAEGLISKLHEIDKEALNFEDQVTYDLVAFIQKNVVEQFQYKAYLNPILVDAGFHIDFAFTPSSYSFESVNDYKNYIKVLNAYPRYVDEHILLMRRGLELGIAQPKVIMDGYEVTTDKHMVTDPEESLFYGPFKNFPSHFSEEETNELKEAGRKAVMDGVVVGYKSFSEFLKGEFIPNTREAIGASDMPNGKRFYEQRIKYYTTLDLSPDSIHQLGLMEVARIKSEMEQIIEEVGFKGSFAEFLNFLRTDEQFYAKTPDELLKAAAYISKSMDGKLPTLFGKLPRQPYTVNPVPDHLAPKYTGGRYVPAAANSVNPGQYWVNTYDLSSRPLYILEALSFHEAVPGHHLQMALTLELTHLPKFRQNLYLSAFGEGWGLYSEFLGKEAGFYADPYSDFGRLTYEMWRACRLVVDTGIHAKEWSRQQVMDYLASNTALSLHEIKTETDRYISWPGQALAYKIGELKIKALRKKAETFLGDKFNIREFHDLLLSQGTVTLPILEQMVDMYVEESQ